MVKQLEKKNINKLKQMIAKINHLTVASHLPLHDCGVVAELPAEVLVVAGAHRDEGAVGYLLEREHLKARKIIAHLSTLPVPIRLSIGVDFYFGT